MDVIACYEKHYIIFSSDNARTSCECPTTTKLSSETKDCSLGKGH